MRIPIRRVALLSASMLVSCVTPRPTISHTSEPIVAAPEVLSQAAAAHFRYLATVRAAEQRDDTALLELIRFSTRTDAFGSIDHGAVLLELREIFGVTAFDEVAAQATKEQQVATKQSMDAATGFLNGPSRPNHAMQPTTGRRTAGFCVAPTLSAAATRALASGG